MTEINKPPLRVFLCHASSDKEIVRVLYHRLVSDGLDAWLDDEKLLPGQKWEVEIPRAVKNSDVVIICLSKNSITKEGYFQKEIEFALDSASEKPEGTIFLIPARLEDCEVPRQLTGWQWVNLFSNKSSLNETDYVKLLQSLQIRAETIGALPPNQSTFMNRKIEYRGGIETQIFKFADLILDTGTRLASRGGRSISLSPTEYQLLKLFLEYPNQVLNQKFILERAWEDTNEGDSNIVEVYIRYLRTKLESGGESRLIQTARGMGYVLRDE